MLIIIVFTLLVLLLIYYPVKDLYLIYVKGAPPGPISIPLIGGLHLLSPSTPHLSVDQLYKKFGPIFTLRMGPFGTTVFIHDLNVADEAFLKTEANDRPKVPFFDLINNGGDGIGSCPCGTDKFRYLAKVLHKGQRKFSNTNLNDRIDPYLSLLMQRFESNSETAYNPRQDIVKSCSAIFSSIVYGINTDCLDSEHLKSRMVYHRTIMSCVNPSHPFNILPIAWKFPSALKNKILECIQHREELMEKHLKVHIEDFQNDIRDMMDIVADSITNFSNVMARKGTSKHDLLLSVWMYYLAGCDTLVDTKLWILAYMSTYPDIQYRIQKEIDTVLTESGENILDKKSFMPYTRCDIIVDNILWILLFIGLHQDVQKRIQKEIDTVLAEHDANVLERKSSLSYTRATIFESLRLSSAVPLGVPRSCNRDITLGGYHIPKDSMIMITQWTIHHDEKHWPEPFKLKPERFLDDDGNLLPLNYIFKKMPFIPFSRGIRSCLGQYMALDILFMFLCNTLQRFSISPANNCKPDLNGKVVMNLRPQEFSVVFKKRKRAQNKNE